MNLEINIDNYVTEDDIKDAILEVIRNSTYRYMNEQNYERILSNISYMIVWEVVDNIMKEKNVDMEKMLTNEIIRIINDLSTFTVFRPADTFTKESYGMKLLNETVENNRNILEEKVIEIMNDYSKISSKIREDIASIIEEQVFKCLGIEG